MRVSVFGFGYVGCVTASCLARGGHDVIGADANPDKVALVNAGYAPRAGRTLAIPEPRGRR